MRLVSGTFREGRIAAPALVFGALVPAVIGLVALPRATYAAPVIVVSVLVALTYNALLSWRVLLATLLLIILFLPIRRYSLPGNLPFQLEPYRLFVLLLGLLWITALLIDPRVKLRRSGFGGPLAAIAATALASVLLDPGRVQQVREVLLPDGTLSAITIQADVAKRLTFFASFLLVFFIIVSLVRTMDDLDFLVGVLVVGGSAVAVAALVEANTHYNVFNHLHSIFPFMKPQSLPYSLIAQDTRGGRLRVYASAEGPIALSAAFVMLTPLSVYLARTRRRRWWIATALLVMGCLATVSRTGILMLLAVALVYLRYRPVEIKRLWPLILPGLVAVHLALPGAIGTFSGAFFPKGGLVREQEGGAGTRGSGRLADVGPALDEWSRHPVFGEGFGTRITDLGRANANILDDQWLGTLLETGILGAAAWIWLFSRFFRRMGRKAKEDPDSPLAWLYVGLAASTLAFAIGMLTYDAFSFTQVTFLLFIMLALGAALLAIEDKPASVTPRRIASRAASGSAPGRRTD